MCGLPFVQNAKSPQPPAFCTSNTLRPTKQHTKGTKRWALHQRVTATLGSGNADLHNVVKLPAGEDMNE
jgi:hypothetical protein